MRAGEWFILCVEIKIWFYRFDFTDLTEKMKFYAQSFLKYWIRNYTFYVSNIQLVTSENQIRSFLEAVVQSYSVRTVFLKLLQDSQEKYFFLWIFKFFKNTLPMEHFQWLLLVFMIFASLFMIFQVFLG